MSTDQIPILAFVTLLTSDSYLPGVLTTLKSLQDAEHSNTTKERYETVCLVTPSTVGQNSIKALEKSFDRVIGVETITTTSWNELNLLGRNDLASSLTKLHIFRLTQYKKLIYLDADTLVLRSISHLFNIPEEFSAAPDCGWPDAFNSGVMVVTPSEKTFEDLTRDQASWDGGDQGLLNEYFKNWNRLSFTYNVTPSAYYTYAPAYRRHGESTSVLHFIGQTKPWTRGNRSNSSTSQDALQNDYYNLIGKWYDVFERHFGMGNTFEVASRVVNPPASFKSTYSDLPNRNPKIVASTSTPLPLPIPIQTSSSSSSSVWDPSKSSPPRNSSALQMKEAITTKYDNVWDDPSRAKQRTRFQAPTQYAPPPSETREWYSSITKTAPNPKALRPVFPWEEKTLTASTSNSTSSSPTSSINSKDSDLPASARIASRTFPEDELPRPLPTINTSSAGSLLVKPSIVSPTFTNAWDSIPGINRYAKSLAKATAAKDLASKNGGKEKKKGNNSNNGNGNGDSPDSSSGGNQGIGWQSSLKEMRDYPRRGDASSRDGDDEDDEEDITENDEEESEVEKDRVKIIFKVKPSQLDTSTTTSKSPIEGRSRSGSAESTTGGLGNLSSINSNNTSSGINKPRKDTRNVPTSPRLGTRPLHHSHHHPGMHERRQSNPNNNTSLTSSSSMTSAAQLASDLLSSPRLAATAIRNSAAAAARAIGAGNGDHPPLIRATRVFSDSTDTSRIKEEGLIALRKFMSQEGGASLAGGMRNNGSSGNAGGGGGGGAGSGGAFMY